MSKKIHCSVGVCVYNEEKNIAYLLDSLLGQRLGKVKIDEVIVVASHSKDKTTEIVRSYCRKYKNIRLISQKKRLGKAAAVNLFISSCRNEVLVLTGGDLLLAPNCLEDLVSPFSRESIGMTGAHPKPLNDIDSGVTGFAAHFLWEMHHRVALKTPKMGEVIAFRKIFRRIPVLSSVDEANIEPLIRGQGFEIHYRPTAVVYNKAPTKLGELINQRRRIYCGHLAVKYEQSYEVSTLRSTTLLASVFSFLMANPKPLYFLYIPMVMLVETVSRFLGWWDYTVSKKRYTVWESLKTTKDLRRSLLCL